MERKFTLSDIDFVAAQLLREYALPQQQTAVLWGLSGDLGAGKTALVQAIARTLGVTETVTSPTFILEKVYKLEQRPFDYLIHIDAYRLDGPQELAVLGWEELVSNPDTIIVLEWPERVSAALPAQTKIFKLETVDEVTRKISYGEKK